MLFFRLEAYDRNQNFNQCDDLMPEFRTSLPAVPSYKDVNADRKMVPLTFENASSYLDKFVVSFDQKIRELYNDLFLLYLRSCETDNFTFCLVLGKAEMRKRIRYIVDISLQMNGRVFKTQCKCGAGEGSFGNCKHIMDLVYTYCKFVKIAVNLGKKCPVLNSCSSSTSAGSTWVHSSRKEVLN